MVNMSDIVCRKRNKSFSSYTMFKCVQSGKKKAGRSFSETITSIIYRTFIVLQCSTKQSKSGIKRTNNVQINTYP